MLSLTQSDPHCYQLDHNSRVYFAIALLINGGGGVNNWMNCLWKIFGQRRVGGGGVRGNVRGEMSRYRPGMAQEKSGHPMYTSVHRMPMGKKSFLEILMSCALTRGLKVLKIGIFHENRLFSVDMFLYSTSSMLCHISLERSANTEKNGISMIRICSYLMSISPL